MNNPFVYGKEVRGYQFYDRRASCDELYGYLKDGSTNVVLYAPRRYGKTSMVIRVLERMKAEGFDCLLFDVSKVATVEKFCEAYATAVYAVYGGLPEIGNQIAQYLLHLHPTVSFTAKGVSVRFEYGERMNEASLTDVLDLPEKLAAETKRPIIVAFDEFQDIAMLSRSMRLESVFRSAIQSHRNARYVFFGSKTHMMKRMFGAFSRPFYKSAFNMKIGKPPREESAEFVSSRFGNEGITVDGEALEKILEVSANIPYYLQAVSGLVFGAVERQNGERVRVEDVDEALERFVESNADLYAEILRNLSPAQRAMIEALAEEPVGRLNEAYRRRHGLSGLSSVHSALTGLVNRGLVESEAKGYVIGDPIFARYVRTESPAKVI